MLVVEIAIQRHQHQRVFGFEEIGTQQLLLG